MIIIMDTCLHDGPREKTASVGTLCRGGERLSQ